MLQLQGRACWWDRQLFVACDDDFVVVVRVHDLRLEGNQVFISVGGGSRQIALFVSTVGKTVCRRFYTP